MSERLTAEAVSYAWGTNVVLESVDLTVSAGECLAVVGPNGAGKTSLLRLLAGVAKPRNGVVRIDGDRLDALSARRRARRIAYVPQHRPAHIALPVFEFVLLGRYARGRGFGWAPSTEDFEAAERAMAEMDVAHLRRRGMDELSGGERQAAFLAAALAQGGGVLVLDEPTAHLDPRHVRETIRRIERLRDSAGLALVVATHDLALAAWVAGRALALREGRAVASGDAARILSPSGLSELFGAPFGSVVQGERAVPVLELGDR